MVCTTAFLTILKSTGLLFSHLNTNFNPASGIPLATFIELGSESFRIRMIPIQNTFPDLKFVSRDSAESANSSSGRIQMYIFSSDLVGFKSF